MAIESPRRSPRISARTSLEAVQRGAGHPPLSPLTARHHGQAGPSMSPRQAPGARKARSSTSAMLFPQQQPVQKQSPGRPAPRGKVARRAYSVGGGLTLRQQPLSQQQRANELVVPSRRNVPGPRKSAIRALPPQVFLSPSQLSPPTSSIRPLFSRKSLGLEAFGGADLMNLMESIGIIKAQREPAKPMADEGVSKLPRKSEPVASSSATRLDGPDGSIKKEDEDATVARKRRRVTFNPHQEKANFEKDEPTMRIRPASEIAATNQASPDASSSSSASSDMSIESESDQDEDDHHSSTSSESEAEVEGQIASMLGNEGGAGDQEHGAPATLPEGYDESAMDMTSVYGGMQDSTMAMSGIAYGSEDDEDDSLSMAETESQADETDNGDDPTMTMQFTEVYGSVETSLFTRTEQGFAEELVEEEEEEDDVEKELKDDVQDASADESDMDMDISQSVGTELIERGDVSSASTVKTAARSSTSPRKSESGQLPSAHANVSPLRTRNAPPNGRVLRSSSPDASAKRSDKTEDAGLSVSPNRMRPSLHERQKSPSPLRGHEHCKIPAAESPKPRLSATTLRVQARREAAARQSPRKSMSAIPLRQQTKIGSESSVQDRMAFRASLSSALPRNSQRQLLEEDARFSSSTLPLHRRQKSESSMTVQDSPSKTRLSNLTSPASPVSKKRPSSPMRTPSSPSKVWQSFREEQRSPTGPKSPARRISVAPKREPSLLGSPQRLDLSLVGRNASRTQRSSTLPDPRESPDTKNVSLAIEETPRITMKAFFDSLNMGFLDLAIPTKRKVERLETEDDERGSDTVAMLRAACVTGPALEGLVEACKELKGSVDDGRIVLEDMEREFDQNPPSYVAEVTAMETTAERQKAISSFKIQKSAARAIASKSYYGWRTDKQFDDSALAQLETTKKDLEDDVTKMLNLSDLLTTSILPRLHQHGAQVSKELSTVRLRQEEIAHWDNVEEMRAMHEAMNEQSAILDEQRATHLETKEQLARLQARLDELDKRRRETEEAIEQAHASSDAIRGSTRDESARLARHVEQMQSLHMWSLDSATNKDIAMVYNDGTSLGPIDLKMKLQHSDGDPMQAGRENDVWVASALVTSLGMRNSKSASTLLVTRLFDALQARLHKELSDVRLSFKPADVVRLVTSVCVRARHMLNTVAQLTARYPTQAIMEMHDKEGDQFVVRSTVLLQTMRTKLVVEARCSVDALLDPRLPFFSPEDLSVVRTYGHPGVSSALHARLSDAILGSDTTSSVSDLPLALFNAVYAIDRS